MCVPIHEARHQHGAGTFDDFVARRRNDSRPDGGDCSVGHSKTSALDTGRIKLNEQRIAKKSRHGGI